MDISNYDIKEFLSRTNYSKIGNFNINKKITYNYTYTNIIIIIISDLFSNYGGLEKQGIFLAKHLKSTGYDVVLYHSDTYRNDVPYFDEIKEFKCINYSTVYIKESSTSIYKQLVKINPDCVIALFSWDEIIIWIHALKHLSIPIIYSESSHPSIIKSRYKRNDRNIVLKCVDCHRVQHDIYKSEIINSIPIVNFIAKHDKINDVPLKQKALYVGRITKSKNILELIDVYRDTDIELHLFGEIFDLDASLFYNNIIHHSYVNDINEIYSTAFSYLHFPSEIEGIPNCVLESLSYGLPVVGYKECEILNHIINDGNGIIQNNLQLPDINKLNSLNRSSIKSNLYKNYNNSNKWENTVRYIVKLKNNTQLNRVLLDSI